MASAKEIKKRIKGVKNIQQITALRAFEKHLTTIKLALALWIYTLLKCGSIVI